ncbi:transcriptional regulator ATRX [Strongylocentrotus purpuratus]|uniref:Uncharacterized protein n=1 Tax=Strongylocentrotus purpuratus TaxID=7668 RepID=A0A7M7PEV9_STRPU|nr:transcriptional regulator ATRX [Strongylocentrotus purpuratus]
MDVDQPDEKIQSNRQDEGLYDFSYDDDGGSIKSPDGAIDDESNMSALDLYTDMVVRDSEEAALSMAKLKEEKSSFKTQLDAALIEVSKLTTVNETLTKENRVLKSNISVLLKTAKMEIQRKERELNELRDMQLDGRRPSANSFSSRSRKTRRGPKQRQQPGPLRQNGAQHPKGPNAGPTPRAMNRTGDSDSDKEQKRDVRETMFVRRQRARNQQQSTTSTSQSSKVPHLSSDKRESGGAKRSIGDTLLHLSRQSSQQIETLRCETKEKDKVGPLMKGSDGSQLQRTMEPNTADTTRHSDPKDLVTKKPEVVISAVPRLEAQREKTTERHSHHLKDRSRSRSVERATRSRSGERSSTKISEDRSKQDQRKVQPRSGSRERSSTSKSDDKRLSPSRSSRSRSDDKRSSRSKSCDKKLSPSRSSSSISHERRSSRSKSRDRDRSKQDQKKVQPRSGSRERSSTSKSDHDKRLSPSRSSRSRSNDKRSSRSKSSDRMLFGSKSSSSISHERRSSRSKSRDRASNSKSRNKPNDLKQRKEEVSQRESSSTSKRSRSERDAIDKQAESLAFSRSRTPRENVSKDRRRDRDRRDSRRSSTPIRDSTRKDSQRSKENRKSLSGVKMPSSRERGQSGARERMSSIAKESVAKAKAMLNKRTSGCSSPKKSHRYDRRRSSKDLCLDGLTEWTKTESSHKETRSGELRKKERGHEGSERKRKHRLSSSFQKESLSHAKKRKAGSNSDDTGKVDIADENHLDAGGINSCTYEEGHTVLACGIRDSIECTSSKVTVLHTSVSDAYDTTQSDTSFLHASGLQVDNGALKQSTGDAVYHLNKEINEERELSEGEIVSDDEEASRTKKSKPKSSEKKKRRLSKHRHSHSKSTESTTHFLKPPRRGKKHKRRRSSDQEAQGRKKRPKENIKSDDSIQSQTEEDASAQKSKACEGGLNVELVSENAFPPITGLDDSEIALGRPDDVDMEKDVSELTETPVDNRPTPISKSEAVGMMHVSESALGACGDIEEVPKTETSSSPVEEGEHEKDENRGERILKFEDAVESETVAANASTEALSEHAISTPIKESVCAGEIQARQGATEADPNVSRGILFEDLCLSSSMDDTSYLSCVNTTSENQRHSFMNSIEKVDDLVKEISDPLVNTSALDMDASQKPTEGHEKLETEISESLGKSALDLHHIPPKTITSEPMPDPSKNGERFSKLQVKNATHDQIVTDGTHLETSPDTSAELNTSKSSEPAQNDAVHSCEKEVLVLNEDKSKSDDHVADEDNDAVSLLAASGYLDSFMHDNAPKVKRHVDLSFDEVEESRGVLKETETVDKTETSLHLTCEWSNIEFQDSSTKMGAEPDQGPVTVVSPFFDDGCAQDMEYATNPMLDEEEHEENKEIFKGDKETEIDFGRTVGDNIKEKEKSQTYMPNEASELRPSKRDPLNLDNMDTSVSDALATEEAGIRTDGHQSCEVKVSGASYSTEKRHSPLSKAKEEDLFPNRVKEEEKEVEKENVGEDEAHVSSNPIVIDDDGVESELDFEEDEEEEQEDSVYIVDVQPADPRKRKRKQEDDSCKESEEESEELNQSESDTSDLESKRDPLKTCVSRDEPSAVGESEGHDKTISGKGLLESNEVESDLDWGSEPEEQNEEYDVSEDREKGTDKDNKENGKLDKKEEEDEKTDGDQQKCEEDSEEEGEILDEEEGEEEHSDGRHDRKEPSEKSRKDQRHRRDHQGHSQSHLHRSVHRDSSSGKRERSSDLRRLDVEGKGERGRSGSSDQDRRSHREVQERDNRKHPKREDRERTGKGRINEERSRRMKEDRREASERRKEEDRKKALERKREEDRRRLDRRKEDERREARRRLEEERRQHEEKKRARTREENKKVRSRLHDSEKKREPSRKSKKVSESRKS